MKKLIPILLGLLLCMTAYSQTPSSYYHFNGYPVQRHTIEAYISRAMMMRTILDDSPKDYLPPTSCATCGSKYPLDVVLNTDLAGTMQLIKTVKPKLITNAVGPYGGEDVWINTADWSAHDHINQFKYIADQIHAFDPEIILDASLWEAILNVPKTHTYFTDGFITLGDDADEQYIYDYFPELGGSPVTISIQDMLYDEEIDAIYAGDIDPATGWLVPDLSKLKTRIWWFYRATQYVKAGAESIHMGRVDLTLKRDCDNWLIKDLMDKIKAFGASIDPTTSTTYARRGVVFFNDALNGAGPEFWPGCLPPTSQYSNPANKPAVLSRSFFQKNQFVYYGNPDEKRLLWDWGAGTVTLLEDVPAGFVWNSGPPNWTPTLANPNDRTKVVILAPDDPAFIAAGHDIPHNHYGQEGGGMHPQGWRTDHAPTMVGLDFAFPPATAHAPYEYTQWNLTYGMDEMTWFLNLPTNQDRKDMLQYIQERVKCIDKNAYFVMPGMLWHTYMWNGYPYSTSGFYHVGRYRANDNWAGTSLGGLDITLKNLLDNTHYNPERAERFVRVNNRDGSIWTPTNFFDYPAFGGWEKGYVGDFNADGKDDLLAIPNNDPGVGFTSWIAHRVYEANTIGNDLVYTNTKSIANPCSGSYAYFSWGENMYVGDFDGDGFKNEVAVVANKSLGTTCPGGVRFYKAAVTWDAVTLRNKWDHFQYTGLTLTFPSYDEKLVIGDYNGDGKDDILAIADKTLGTSWQGFKILLNTFSSGTFSFASPILYPYNPTPCCTSWGENFYAGDFNGDGRSDLLVVANKALGTTWDGARIFSSQDVGGALVFQYDGNISSCPVSTCFPSYDERYFVGDFNNDGKDDFIVTADKRVGASWQGYYVFMNKYASGTYYFENKGLDGCTECCYPSWGERFNIGDFNGDGSSDFMVSPDYALGIGGPWSLYWSKAADGVWKPGKRTEGNLDLSKPLLYPIKTEGTNKMDSSVVEVYPNPVNDKIFFRFNLEKTGTVSVVISSMDGKEVKKQQVNLMKAGLQEISIEASDLPDQVYTYSFFVNDKVYKDKFVKISNH